MCHFLREEITESVNATRAGPYATSIPFTAKLKERRTNVLPCMQVARVILPAKQPTIECSELFIARTVGAIRYMCPASKQIERTWAAHCKMAAMITHVEAAESEILDYVLRERSFTVTRSNWDKITTKLSSHEAKLDKIIELVAKKD